MSNDRFSIGEAFRYSWDTFKENLTFFIVVMLIVLPINVAFFVVDRFITYEKGFIYLIVSTGEFLVTVFIIMALIQIGLHFTAGEKADFGDLYRAYNRYWRFLVGYILYVLIVIGGLILLIVPGIIWAVKYQFFGYFIIDQGMKPKQALTRSGQMTMGVKGDLFVFDLAIIGISILGYLALVIGQIVATPIILLAVAYLYRKLLTTEGEQVRDYP